MALASEIISPVSSVSPSEEAIAEIIEAVRGGDLDRFDLLVEWHRDLVHRMAWRLAQDQDTAMDIVQEVFVRVYRGLRGWKGNSKFSTWLYRIAMNTAIDVMRQEARHRRHQTPLLDEHLATIPETRSGSNPRHVAARNQLRARVFESLVHLSPKQRECFTLRHYQGLSLSEIGEALGCSEGAVKKHLARAVERLRKHMGVP
ncbi:RNA polymerase sigma factor [Candidatus Sumerlaeota bacterium]|nr:RNA polymerase sigma factor [Candidatus Sumerlaeota bacterium]